MMQVGAEGPLWHYMVGQQKMGPVPLAQLQMLVRSGQLGSSVMVWTDGMPQWVPAGRLPIFGGGASGDDPMLGLLVPTGNLSGTAVAAGYCGLLGLIPVVGLIGMILGVVAILDLKKNPEKKGWGRAITGIVAGTLFTALYALVFMH
jgi:hypothetical protein